MSDDDGWLRDRLASLSSPEIEIPVDFDVDIAALRENLKRLSGPLNGT